MVVKSIKILMFRTKNSLTSFEDLDTVFMFDLNPIILSWKTQRERHVYCKMASPPDIDFTDTLITDTLVHFVRLKMVQQQVAELEAKLAKLTKELESATKDKQEVTN